MNPFIKIIYINWPLQFLILATALFGFLMLYSVSGGSWDPWTKPQINRFSISFLFIFVMAVISISFWQRLSPLSYIVGLALLIAVYFYGDTGMGAKRWLDLRVIKLQPSEVFKISMVMALAYYYHKLPFNLRNGSNQYLFLAEDISILLYCRASIINCRLFLFWNIKLKIAF